MIKWVNKGLEEIFYKGSDKEFDDDRLIGQFIIVVLVWISPLLFTLIWTFKNAWGESYVEFGQQFIAELIFYFGRMSLLSMSLGLIVGFKIWAKCRNKSISWLAGILIISTIYFVSGLIAQSIPGVDWRFNEIIDHWLESAGDY